jgi:hypothetical protein
MRKVNKAYVIKIPPQLMTLASLEIRREWIKKSYEVSKQELKIKMIKLKLETNKELEKIEKEIKKEKKIGDMHD